MCLSVPRKRVLHNCRHDNHALGIITDGEKFASQFRIISLLDGRVEGILVDINDFPDSGSAGKIRRCQLERIFLFSPRPYRRLTFTVCERFSQLPSAANSSLSSVLSLCAGNTKTTAVARILCRISSFAIGVAKVRFGSASLFGRSFSRCSSISS